MRWLPFFAREANALIKIYPRRVVFELPKIDEKIISMKVVKFGDSWYVIGVRG